MRPDQKQGDQMGQESLEIQMDPAWVPSHVTIIIDGAE